MIAHVHEDRTSALFPPVLFGAGWRRAVRPERSQPMNRQGETSAPNTFMHGSAAESPTPEHWLRLVAERQDKAAFARVFEHFAPRIKGYMMRLGCSATQSEDLAQEAMVSVWRKAGLFEPEKASAATWIFTIARNLRIDQVRRERRPEIDPSDPALLPDPDPAADDVIEGRQQEVRIRRALAGLPPDQARVIELSFFAGKAHAAIADELNIPLGTVKSRLRLAFGRIRDALKDSP
jgi:RNA polymerase sigma factor (sigma-70 family)